MSPGPDQPGESTITRALRGEPVVEELLAEELPRLRAFVRAHLSPELRLRESVSDLVQSVCRGLLSQRSFEFRGEAQFRAWLFLAARHKIAEKARFHLREQRDVRRELNLDDASGILNAHMATPSRVVMAREHLDKLEQAIDELEPDHREVVTLVRVAGLPLEEAAAAMQRSRDATRMLLGRALLKLGANLRRLGIDGSQAPS